MGPGIIQWAFLFPVAVSLDYTGDFSKSLDILVISLAVIFLWLLCKKWFMQVMLLEGSITIFLFQEIV